MAQANQAHKKIQQSNQIADEIKAEIERIGNSNPYIETDRELEFYHWLDEQRRAKVCGLALEDKGSGLSQACQYYRFTSVSQKKQLFSIPLKVLYVKVSQPGAARHLFIDILNALQRPLNSGSLRDLRSRVKGTLKTYQVQLLLVDDAHVLKRQAMTELVKIFDDLRIPVVMAGVKELDQKLTQCQGYGHINNSFLGGYNFRTLSEEEITSVTQSWEEQVLSNWDTKLNLVEDSEIIEKLYSATGGLVQPLYGCLRKIAIAQLENSFSDHPNEGIDIDRVIGQHRQARIYEEDCQ